jgi:hypothetical protein
MQTTTTTAAPIVFEIPKEWEQEIAEHERHTGKDGVWRPCEDGSCVHCDHAKSVDVLTLQLKRQGHLK